MPLSRLLCAMALFCASAGPALAQKQGGTLRITHRDNPPSASIIEEATISTDMPFMSVFNNLVVFDPDSPVNRLDRIVPDLATSWAWSDDDRTLTFQLREGVKWHDGKPFTSADVKCTWDMLTGKVANKLRKNPRKTWWFNIKDVVTDGDNKVIFHLNDPQPSIMAMFASGFAPVYPCHVPGNEIRTHPIGTGPFMFGEFKQNESIRVVRNPNYWKPGKPYLNAIEYTIIPNRSTMVLALLAGKFDMSFTGELTPELVKSVQEQAPSLQCVLQPTNTQGNLLVNRERPPFDNPQIRKAMMLAIDRKAFSDILSRGVYPIGGANMPPPEGFWGWSKEYMETVPGYGADVEKSREEGRQIMRSLGYGPDHMLPLKVTTRNIQDYRDAAVVLIDHLKTIYIQAELEPIDTSVWYARLLRKDYSVAMNVQGTGTDDPDVQFFENYLCGSERNYTSYCNPELEKKYHQQSQMKDIDARRKLVWDIDKQLQEDGARPVIYFGVAGTCWWPRVHGIKIARNTVYNHWRFEDVWLDQ
ncbi:MAG: ABC transporter substrate-binding protein [Rhodopila sp.]